MKNNEIEFEKYEKRGAYHWEQASGHLSRGNAFVRGRYQKCVELAKVHIGELEGKQVLDLGCGDGVLTYKFVEEGADCYGADLSSIAIEYAKRKHEENNSAAKFKCASAYETGYKGDFFDIVVCSDVIEHLNDPVKLLGEIKRVLKPGGRGIISTPVKFTQEPLDAMHVVEWYPSEFKALIGKVFGDAGFCTSHPLWWFEVFSLSRFSRIGINALSSIKNPFLGGMGEGQYHCLQYAIVQKDKK